MDRLPETPASGPARGAPRAVARSQGLWVTGLALLGLFASPSHAEDYRPGGSIPTGETINPRTGFIIGPFLFTPSAKVGYSYDSNIFNVEDGFPIFVQSDPDGDGTMTTHVVEQREQGGSIVTGEARLALRLPFSHSYASL